MSLDLSPDVGMAAGALAGVLIREGLALLRGLVNKLEEFLNGLKSKLENLLS
jgi:hypothetical protein